MEKKLNCWESKKCGREPGGPKAAEFGVCPAASNMKVAGVHGGHNGGRACWAIAGTLCGNKVQGTFASKMEGCVKCEFYQQVRKEEGADYLDVVKLLEKLK